MEIINKKYGYLREHSSKAKGHDTLTGLNRTGLDVYLSVIYPGVDFVHDKAMGGDNKEYSRKRPDYRNDDLKLIIEFDGLQHYTKPENIKKDDESNKLYKKLGYSVVRIPYFIQLTKEAVKELFGVDVKEELFDISYPSLTDGCTPACLCPLGVERMAKEFLRFPDQYQVNINALKAWPEENSYKNGYEFLEREYKRQKGKTQTNK